MMCSYHPNCSQRPILKTQLFKLCRKPVSTIFCSKSNTAATLEELKQFWRHYQRLTTEYIICCRQKEIYTLFDIIIFDLLRMRKEKYENISSNCQYYIYKYCFPPKISLNNKTLVKFQLVTHFLNCWFLPKFTWPGSIPALAMKSFELLYRRERLI